MTAILENMMTFGKAGIIKVLLALDILIVLAACCWRGSNIAKKTFRLYLIYACILTATAFLDYVIDTWYLQNLAIFLFHP